MQFYNESNICLASFENLNGAYYFIVYKWKVNSQVIIKILTRDLEA